MIVLEGDGGLLVVTQSDHARLAGEILALWRQDGLPDHPRRRSLLLAVREHDNGWQGIDAAPRVDPASGRPYGYRELPTAERAEVWRRGTSRWREREPWVAALIVEHARRLHRGHEDDPHLGPLLEELEEARRDLLETVAEGEEEVDADYRFLAAADALSLAACEEWEAPFEALGRRASVVADRLEIVPFPLAGSTSFLLPCRRIDDRRYRGDADLAVALASARWEERRLRVVPPA